MVQFPSRYTLFACLTGNTRHVQSLPGKLGHLAYDVRLMAAAGILMSNLSAGTVCDVFNLEMGMVRPSKLLGDVRQDWREPFLRLILPASLSPTSTIF